MKRRRGLRSGEARQPQVEQFSQETVYAIAEQENSLFDMLNKADRRGESSRDV
jgi:hypothetical protein